MKNFVAVTLLVLFAGFVWAQDSNQLYVGQPDPKTLGVQQKVEALYKQGEYQRAHFIYENELAPIGDKYAQYMVGFMYLTGTGVEEDPVLASAWYRLAAERSFSEFVAVRDELLESLEDDEKLASDRAYLRLRRNYSDLAILQHEIGRYVRHQSLPTGSRLQGGSSTATIVDPKRGSTAVIDQEARRWHKLTEQRLRLLDKLLGGGVIETDPDDVDLAALETLVEAQIEDISDR